MGNTPCTKPKTTGLPGVLYQAQRQPVPGECVDSHHSSCRKAGRHGKHKDQWHLRAGVGIRVFSISREHGDSSGPAPVEFLMDDRLQCRSVGRAPHPQTPPGGSAGTKQDGVTSTPSGGTP